MASPAVKFEEECQFCKEINDAGKYSQPPKLSLRGKIILGVSGTVFAGFTAVLVPFVFPGLRRIALPYIPASDAQIKNVLKSLKGRSGSLIDIGSGDGRIVITAAHKGFSAHGVELNRWLVMFSRWKAWKEGLHGKVSFHRRDLWKFDLSKCDNVVIFGVEAMMEPLQKKLEKEMIPGSKVVACRFPLPSVEPALTIGEGVDTVWLYSFPCSPLQKSKDTS